MPETTVPVEIPDWMMARLGVLIDPDQGLPDLAAVIGTLLDHVQQGVYRPGAWERSWLEQAFGDSWQARLEPDPGTPFDRPIPPRPGGPPEWEHHAYGVGLSAGEFEDDPIVGGGHIDPRRFIASCSAAASLSAVPAAAGEAPSRQPRATRMTSGRSRAPTARRCRMKHRTARRTPLPGCRSPTTSPGAAALTATTRTPGCDPSPRAFTGRITIMTETTARSNPVHVPLTPGDLITIMWSGEPRTVTVDSEGCGLFLRDLNGHEIAELAQAGIAAQPS